MFQSENINELASALSKAQGEFTPALKDSANPFFKSKYANLCSIVKSCQEPLSKYGISFSQSTQKMDGEWVLLTRLMHSSGQWVQSITPIITIKPDIQSFGSACTYARRYALAAITGVTTDEDDDGETATAPFRKTKEPAQPKEDSEEMKLQRAKQETTKILQFLAAYPNENGEMIKSYIQKYAAHWKKSISDAIQDYSNHDKFVEDFSKWKEKELAKAKE